jgi:tetratricopeptide (TPR) repeat protein
LSKTAEKALNFFGGMATNVSASAFFASMPSLGFLCLGLAAVLTATDATIQEKAAKEEGDKLTQTLRRLIKKTDSIEKALELLGGENDLHEIVSRERTAKLLKAIRKQATDTKSLLSENTELTAQVGIWVQRWCDEQGTTLEVLSDRLDFAAKELGVRLDRIESRVAQADAGSQERDELTHDMLRQILAQRSEDYEAEIDAAKQRLMDARPDEALVLLNRLKERSWGKLSDRQKFRVLANMGHAYDAKDDYTRAAGFFLEAKQYQPNDPHAQSLACLALAYKDDREAALQAEELRATHPENALAQALWLRFQPDDADFAKLVAAVPERLRGDAEVAAALSRRAFRQGKFVEAEDHARLALKDATYPRIKLNLGTLLVDIERKRVQWVEGAGAIVHDEAKLKEAISLLTEANDAFGHSAGAQTITTIRRARGLAYTLLDQREKAEQDFQVAYDRSPNDPASSLDYALMQAERGQGGIDRAIEALEKVARPGELGQQDLQLARLLAKRNQDDDRHRATVILRAAITSDKDWDEPLRIQAVGMLTEILGAAKDHDGARTALQHMPPGFLPKTILMALESGVVNKAGDEASAAALARKAVASLNDESTESERRLIAKALFELKLYSEALPLLKQTVQPQYVGQDTLRLLEAAHECGDDATVLDFCRSLRANGRYDSSCLDMEIATLAEYNGFTAGIEILRGFISSKPEDADLRLAQLRLSVLGIEADQPAVIETDPAKLPDVYTVNARTGEAVAHVLSHHPEPFKAVDYAYTLVRRHFDKKAAHRALIRAFMFGTTKKPHVPASTEVKAGFAAIYKTEHEEKTSGLIIEDATSPLPSFERHEIPPTDARAEELNGKHVGNLFHVRKSVIQDIKATVVEVVHKSVFRVRDSLEHFEERFNDDFVISISIPKREDGSMDLSPIFRSVDQRQKAITEVEDLFRVNRLPVAFFATALGTPILPAMEYIASRWDLSIHSSIGNDEEQRDVLELTPKSLVLAPSAIATLKMTGVYRILKDLPFKLIVSQGTLNEYRRLYAEAMAQSEEGGIMTKIEDRHVFVPNEKSQFEKRRADLKELLDWLMTTCQVLDGTPLAYWPRDERAALIRGLGRPSAESAALAAQEDRILWDDDMAIGQLTKQLGVRRIWTQAIFSQLTDAGQVATTDYCELTINLLRYRHRFTRINGQTLLHAIEKTRWNASDPTFRIVLDALSDPSASSESVTGVIIDFLRRIWSSAVSLENKLAATQALLMAMDRRPGGRGLVRVIQAHTRIMLPETPNYVLHLRWFLKNWLLTGSITDLTWTVARHEEWMSDEI